MPPSNYPLAERLDLTGLKCPLPVLRANKVLRARDHGDVIEVTADDPATAKDFPAYCQTAGHALIEAREEAGGRFVFHIRKGG
ncbi:MAG TPA: sulfurtransferase TusA family protein [Alphaproteobacteria bacterium]|jgi:tRNA 2-thiouridine synthesizing protein A